MKLPELLAPAGNMERLETALQFGADAVYLGAKRMSLRNFADNFSLDELEQACILAHQKGKRIYVTVNAFAKDPQLKNLGELLQDIQAAGADALIVNDPGVIDIALETVPDMELHLSTQANTLNSRTATFWHRIGIKRIVLARELSIQEMAQIRQNIPETLELEAFVHGAMCVSYSGRCLLSNYINGRDSNRGECAQPCRWTYEIRETGTQGDFFPIEQDDLGTYILNSRDLNLMAHIPDLIEAGIGSLKIEGRMKSIYYVAGVVNAYRMALDAYRDAKQSNVSYRLDPALVEELEQVSHRPYTTGFALGAPGGQSQYPQSASYTQGSTLVGRVLQYDSKTNRALLEQRNRFYDGEVLSVLSPGKIQTFVNIEGMWADETGEALQAAPHPKQRVWIGCKQKLNPGDLLRRKENDAIKGKES